MEGWAIWPPQSQETRIPFRSTFYFSTSEARAPFRPALGTSSSEAECYADQSVRWPLVLCQVGNP